MFSRRRYAIVFRAVCDGTHAVLLHAEFTGSDRILPRYIRQQTLSENISALIHRVTVT